MEIQIDFKDGSTVLLRGSFCTYYAPHAVQPTYSGTLLGLPDATLEALIANGAIRPSSLPSEVF
jgi:hypothetical protein